MSLVQDPRALRSREFAGSTPAVATEGIGFWGLRALGLWGLRFRGFGVLGCRAWGFSGFSPNEIIMKATATEPRQNPAFVPSRPAQLASGVCCLRSRF